MRFPQDGVPSFLVMDAEKVARAIVDAVAKDAVAKGAATVSGRIAEVARAIGRSVVVLIAVVAAIVVIEVIVQVAAPVTLLTRKLPSTLQKLSFQASKR